MSFRAAFRLKSLDSALIGLRKFTPRAPKPLKREFFISAPEGGKTRGRCEKSALLRVGIPRHRPSCESLPIRRQSPRARILQQRADGGKACGQCEKRVSASRNPSIQAELRKSVMERESSEREFFISAREGGKARGQCEKRSPASRNPSIRFELRKLLWERESPPRARIHQQRAGRRQGTRARRKISVPASRNPSILSAFRKLLWSGKAPEREFFNSAPEGGRARGRCEQSALLRVGIPRYCPRFESCRGSGKAPEREFFISAREGGKARGQCEKRTPASRNPSILSELRKLLWERQSPSSAYSSTARRKAAGLAGAAKDQRSCESESFNTVRVSKVCYGSAKAPQARILHKRVGRRQGTRARRKIHGEIAAVPFQETRAATGADAAFVPRIGRAPFSGCAANAKKRCGSTPLR